MIKIGVELGERSYEIVLGTGILHQIGEVMKSMEVSGKTAVVSNTTVFPLYGAPVVDSMKDAGFEAFPVILPDGEEYKNLDVLTRLYDELLGIGLDRKSAVIALGGGVVGDIAGFAAATYMRGIAYVQVPTTLLAQVDSSVGGKTGIDHAAGKNMIGAFWQPKLVWTDSETLRTLPERQLLAGMAEVIKYGIIRDKDLFGYLELNRERILSRDDETMLYLIRRSCGIKAEIVSKDERESGLRAVLNYGHTIGHAVETVTGYTRFLHGEAVAIGMLLEAELAARLGLLSSAEVEKIRGLIESFGLPSGIPDDIDSSALLSSMQLDKKALGGALRFVLPERIGKVRIQTVATKELMRLFRD
jgi:3-dehydroquinate synthase